MNCATRNLASSASVYDVYSCEKVTSASAYDVISEQKRCRDADITMSRCGDCENKLDNQNDFITCSVCNSKYHYDCGGVSAGTWKGMGKRREKWKCSQRCRKSQSEIESNNEEDEEEIIEEDENKEEQTTDISTTSIMEMRQTMDRIEKKMDKMMEVYDKLMEMKNEVKEVVKTMESMDQGKSGTEARKR